ncbi:ABC transporter substrate-binding protein [Paenibacillus agricola]|uniref:Sugar ABC transporter substrate-binding protein n=1 Tax=Paenibacillus agricola TaxID=2716264 RepID=A0ABX0J0I8_9BACL|nr:sugar ABC transporter substrate-binding protein [Paenibacillus agricola]NHN28975.1 sugar ABC transporter substrate-binding protein [Paenibacillus agricola]
MKRKLVTLMSLAVLSGGVLGCSTAQPSNTGAMAPKTEAAKTDAPKTDTAAKADPAAKAKIRVAWWGSQDRNDKTLKTIDLFMKKNPNIEVQSEFIGFDDYMNKVNTQAAGGNLPDVMQIHEGIINEYVSRNLLVDLNPFVTKGTINLKNVDAIYLPDKVDGKLWGINLGTNSATMVYDPALFAKAGVEELKPGYTYDDMANALRAIKAKLGNDFYGITLDNGYDGLKHYVRQSGTMFYSADGKKLGYTDDKVFVDYFTFWQKLMKEGLTPTPEVQSEFKQLENSLLVNGKAAIQPVFSNQIVALSTAAKRPLKMTVYPSLPNGKEGHFLKAAMSFAVTSGSKNQEAAAKLIDFFTNDVEGNDILAAERGIPVSSEIRKSVSAKVPETSKQMFSYIEIAQKYARESDPPSPAGDTEIRTLVSKIQEQINFGKLTPEEGAKQFRKDAESILAKNVKK